MATEMRAKWASLVKGMFAVSRLGYKQVPSTWKSLWHMKKTSEEYMESLYYGGYGMFNRKPEDSPYTFTERPVGPKKRWVPDTYGLGARISEEAFEDQKYGVMKDIFKCLGISAAETRAFLAMRPYMLGEVTVNPQYVTSGGGNGIPLPIFSATAAPHVSLNGGTWFNWLAAAAPTEAALKAAIVALTTKLSEDGYPQQITAAKVLCGESLRFSFVKLLGSAFEPGTANNAINPVHKMNLSLQVEPLITDNRWFVIANDFPDKNHGFIIADRLSPTIAQHGDVDTGAKKFYGRFRMQAAVGHPRGIIGVPGP